VCVGVGEILPRGALVDCSKSFSRGVKSGEIWFLPLGTKKTAFLVKFSNSCPASDTHTRVEENIRATQLKIGVVLSLLTPF